MEHQGILLTENRKWPLWYRFKYYVRTRDYSGDRMAVRGEGTNSLLGEV